MSALSIYQPQSGISIGQVSSLLGRVPQQSVPTQPVRPQMQGFQSDVLQLSSRNGIPAKSLLMTPNLLKNWNAALQLAPVLPSLPNLPVHPQPPMPQAPVKAPSLPPLPLLKALPVQRPELTKDSEIKMKYPNLLNAPDELLPEAGATQVPGQIFRPIPRPAEQDNTRVAPKPPLPSQYLAGIHDTGLKDKYGRKIILTEEAAKGLREILAIAKSKGIRVDVFSSYRSVEQQRELFNKAVKKYGSVAQVSKWVAPPGKSRHNQGQAIDIHMYRNGKKISQKEFDSITAQAGMYRPMSWESWHIEPLSTRKSRF